MPRITLLNGCSCSQPNVHPANWKAVGASCRKDWYITYRFYDPVHQDRYPKGKLVMVKGMNGYKTVAERQSSTAQILKDLLFYLKEKHYNAISDDFMSPPEPDQPAVPVRTAPILPEDGLWRGLIFARTMKEIPNADGATDYQPQTASQVDYYLRRIFKSMLALNLHTIPLMHFRRGNLMNILTHMGSEKVWSVYTWNNCLGYLSGLFHLLNTWEAMEVNPVYGIDKKEPPEPDRTTLTPAERKKVDKHLRENNRRFWLFVNIFFHSGAREIELLRVRREDVDLENQLFYVITRKGKKKPPKRELKAIKDIALPFWREYLFDSPEGEYLFCKDWVPGTRPYTRDHLTHLWQKLVKIPLGIDADLYTLKHLNYDEIDERLGTQIAAAQAGHTSDRMSKHYAVTKKKRQMDKVKGVQNSFA